MSPKKSKKDTIPSLIVSLILITISLAELKEARIESELQNEFATTDRKIKEVDVHPLNGFFSVYPDSIVTLENCDEVEFQTSRTDEGYRLFAKNARHRGLVTGSGEIAAVCRTAEFGPRLP